MTLLAWLDTRQYRQVPGMRFPAVIEQSQSLARTNSADSRHVRPLHPDL